MRIPSAEQNPVDTSSNTTIANVDVISHLGVFEVKVDNHTLDIGTVVKAKGTVSEFRGVKQLDLKRIWVVTTTNEEAQAWAETAAFKQEFLSSPWHISSAEHTKIKHGIKAEKKKVQEYERRRAEHEAKKKGQREMREAYLAQRETKLEMRRKREEVMMNAGALK